MQVDLDNGCKMAVVALITYKHCSSHNCRIELEWLCLGSPNAHHDVMPCAPEKIPEFSLQVIIIAF